MPRRNSFVIGNIPKVVGVFRRGNNLVDPPVVTVKVRSPSGVTTTHSSPTESIVQAGPGTYYYLLNANSIGEWVVRFEATGANAAAQEVIITIVPSRV